MARARFRISHAGPQCSVQDAGRFGRMRYGVPASGPMDRHAYAVANAALGNRPGAAAIEVSLGGLVLDCVEGALSFAVAGGGFHVSVDADRLASWTVASLGPGQRLSVRPGDRGSWACLALSGDLAAPDWLGSRATHSLSGLGGGMLRTGDMIELDGAVARPEREGDIAIPQAAYPADAVRVVLGPQDRFFDAASLKAFVTGPFALTAAYDRMGVQLSGPQLRIAARLDMPSEPVLRGSVQVSGEGIATVLLADHQTTGGYPKIATVLSCDLDRFAQLRSGASVRFVPVSPAEAISIVRACRLSEAADLAALTAAPVSLAQRLQAMNLISGVIGGTDI